MSFPDNVKPSAMAPATRSRANHRYLLEILCVATLLLLHCILAVSSVRHKSSTFDEYIHMTAGYSYWTTNDYRLQPENGNFPQRWAALPLLFNQVSFPAKDAPLWKTANVWEIGYHFFYSMGNDPDAMLFKGRVMICILSVALAGVVFIWSRQIFGIWGGYLSLLLYTFSPSIIAHARLTTSDMASALFFILALKLLWDVIHRVTWPRVVFTGLAVAGLLLSKMSGVLIAPMLLLLGAARLFWKKPLVFNIGTEKIIHSRVKIGIVMTATLVVVAVAAVLVVWGFYGFRFSAGKHLPDRTELSFSSWPTKVEHAGTPGKMIEFCRDRKILPEAYLYGLCYVISHAEKRSAFLAGEYSMTGWWYFFPYCYAVKTPLTSMLLLVIALAVVIRHPDSNVLYGLTPLGVFIGVYWAVAVTANINIGHRHILVTYPAFFVISGAAVLWLRKFKKIGVVLLVTVIMTYIPETLVIWPDYLAFFNVAAGGPQQGYRRLVDSSLDWGQDLPALSRWLRENNLSGKASRVPVYVSYFGVASPHHYGLDTRMIVSRVFPWYSEIKDREVTRFGPGIYCISATSLQQVYGVGKWQIEDEKRYRQLIKFDREYQAARVTPETWDALNGQYGGFEQIARLILKYRELRFGRLCHYLKQRQPDQQIGHSILIYFVGPGELRQALYGTL